MTPRKKPSATRKPEIVVRPRIRISRGEVIVLGPGKADLLDAIGRTGSIRAAAAEMGMSYMRAWGLVRTMNEQFESPLVTKSRGGTKHGSAQLTELGSDVSAIYREMEAKALRAIAPAVRKLKSRLR